MTMKVNLTRRQIESMVRRYENGEGAASLAERFGISQSTVLNKLREENVEIRPRGRPVTA